MRGVACGGLSRLGIRLPVDTEGGDAARRHSGAVAALVPRDRHVARWSGVVHAADTDLAHLMPSPADTNNERSAGLLATQAPLPAPTATPRRPQGRRTALGATLMFSVAWMVPDTFATGG